MHLTRKLFKTPKTNHYHSKIHSHPEILSPKNHRELVSRVPVSHCAIPKSPLNALHSLYTHHRASRGSGGRGGGGRGGRAAWLSRADPFSMQRMQLTVVIIAWAPLGAALQRAAATAKEWFAGKRWLGQWRVARLILGCRRRAIFAS